MAIKRKRLRVVKHQTWHKVQAGSIESSYILPIIAFLTLAQ